ncbi:hypothetical protein ACLOJK_010425 [Asimina triloba]
MYGDQPLEFATPTMEKLCHGDGEHNMVMAGAQSDEGKEQFHMPSNSLTEMKKKKDLSLGFLLFCDWLFVLVVICTEKLNDELHFQTESFYHVQSPSKFGSCLEGAGTILWEAPLSEIQLCRLQSVENIHEWSQSFDATALKSYSHPLMQHLYCFGVHL